MSATEETRIERDSMGEMQVPAHAYWGASTHRAVLNFPISDLRFPRQFIRALGQIKQAAAQVNEALGTIDPQIAEAIVRAAQEVIDGKLDDHFVLDIFQTGSGTSTNMNANEVIANRASELLGGSRGSRKVHPNDHVNFGQSSNDVIPTAIHLAALVSIKYDLIPALRGLQIALEEKAEEFMPVIKTGRTHLQDATPIRLGQEFQGYAGQIERGIARMRHAQNELSEVALGGTAVGTGVNTHPEFAGLVCRRLSEIDGVTVHETSNHFQAQSTLDNVVEASGYNLLQSISLLASVTRNFTEQCIKGIKATTKGPEMVERGLAISTALAPIIGYDEAASISKEAYKTGKTIREVARERTNLSEEELDRILDPASMTKPGLEGGPAGG